MRVLVANFFPGFHPPRSGGEQRYHYFYRHLSRHYDVTLLSPTYSNSAFEEVRFSPSFRELRVPKQEIFDRLHWELDAKGIGPECSAYVVALAAALETGYASRFASAAIEADIIIHESPFTLPYDRSFGTDGKPRIYNAYNVEHRLAQQILHGDAGAKASDFIRFLERTLARHAALVFTTSDEDRQLLASDFDIELERIALAPNGFEPTEAVSLVKSGTIERVESRVVFIGSAHPPNVEAARFMVDRLAPSLPAVEFRILGAACDKLQGLIPGNVRLLGFVDEAAKRRELERCAAAINPMFSGSGTNLKALDYLAAAAPVVVTPVGARGLSLTDGVTAFIAEGDDFADRLRQVLADAPLRTRVGNAGRVKAFSEFTWSHIADVAHASIQTMISARRSGEGGKLPRRLVLVVNDFPVAQPTGGGEVRIRELLIELGRQFDVVLLCLTQESRRTERRLALHVREIRIPKTLEHRDAEIQATRRETVSINDLLAAEFCNGNPDFVAAFRQIVPNASAIVFEHPYLSPLLRYVPADVPVVYSSLNVERTLKTELLRVRRDAAGRVHQADELERRLLERANVVICVSEEDRNEFSKDASERRYVVIENGVRTASRDLAGAQHAYPREASNDRALAVFVGSAHPPNVEAARFLIEVVATMIPALDVAIVGSVCSGLGPMPRPPNVHLLGTVSEPEKNGLLARADLALNPLFSGGGSSLKVPDFFASGLPVISTRTGVRGYELRDGEHYLEADRENFVERTRYLIENRQLRERLGGNARRYAESELDWAVLGRHYRRTMTELVGGVPMPRVLVVTYRFADPPPGGAEAFMVNVLKQLDRRSNLVIEVATCDIDTIADKWHFSADYVRRDARRAIPAYIAALHRFSVEPPDPKDFERCAQLFRVWMSETRAQALALRTEDGRNALLGGWNFPERHDGKVRRWTSRESQLQVDRAATAIRIRGRAPRSTPADIRRGGHVVASRTLAGPFEWVTELGAGDPVVTLFTERTYETDADPRELGFVVDEIALRDDTGWQSIALDEDFETASRRSDGARWVESLIDTTHRRNRADDDLFFAVRGPHSTGLEDWLEANVAGYDAVLAQGTPFSTPVMATNIAVRHGVPVILLPHFHMEDRYYHWRHYYDAFRSAHRVIAAPESVKSIFFDAIGAASLTLPGGGIDPEEFGLANLVRADAAFRALHAGAKPFVLVLGRKTGAKNYRLTIDAVTALNREGHEVDLVLIGPDEDGIALTEPHTICYGAQSRDVVLGALARSLCLVNMSESESFGIVLLESWFAGRPVIAQRRCIAFTDLVTSGENGLLVETASELAQAIETYLTDEGCAKRHAREGRTVAEQHAWSRIAQQIETVLMEATFGSERIAPSGRNLQSAA
ncbi:MAG: glycosyltransferase [Pseudomonadota bacterium]|nr:glycosyltransferase [Pseudomonadota bacterium]